MSRTEKGSSFTIATFHRFYFSILPIPLFTYHISFFLLHRHSSWLSGDTLLYVTSNKYITHSLRKQDFFVWNSLLISILRFHSIERMKNGFHSYQSREFAHADLTIDGSMSTDCGNGKTTRRCFSATQSKGEYGSVVELQYFV